MPLPYAAAARTCPCGSGDAYRACCGPVHDGAPAETAERLMRSRYTAFVLGNVDHLFRTWHPRTRPDDLSLPPGVAWTGLEILATRDGGADDTTGEVEFVAHSRSGDAPHALHETSRFERRAHRWVYVDGEVDPDVRLRSRG